MIGIDQANAVDCERVSCTCDTSQVGGIVMLQNGCRIRIPLSPMHLQEALLCPSKFDWYYARLLTFTSLGRLFQHSITTSLLCPSSSLFLDPWSLSSPALAQTPSHPPLHLPA